MGGFISKICSHIYVEGALEAVKLYKEAFELEDRGTPWLDEDGVLCILKMKITYVGHIDFYTKREIICAFIDSFGVSWHFQVPKDWNASFVPKGFPAS